MEPRLLSRVAFYIFSPCLVFHLLTENQLGEGAILQMMGFAGAVLLSTALLAWLAARLLKLDRATTVVLVLAALLPNAGNFGLSVNLFAFGEQGLAYASLFFITSSILAYTVGVYIASLGRSGFREALLGLFKVPAIYAVILALLFGRLGWELPTPFARATSVLADAAIPTMLVLLGMLLRQARWSGKIPALATASFLRLIASPAIAFAIAGFFGLQGAARQAGILEAAMPTAVMVTVIASEFEVEAEFLTAIVFTSTLLSPLTITPILALLTQ